MSASSSSTMRAKRIEGMYPVGETRGICGLDVVRAKKMVMNRLLQRPLERAGYEFCRSPRQGASALQESQSGSRVSVHWLIGQLWQRRPTSEVRSERVVS